ncbi:aspartate-semialdehyde dehydrogenase [Pseudomonas schmalbachii]|uniref:Aspartate-semialdehyde dehydrogenase n=1 Tax=Pseudomonas schmalbachii TaxID=2816993 RepID=A0ABS3TV04_9PSED|nr:aspartate-semialdehyde dehydrogenase [Pseudomonas schmalbachii]MBO3276404.1 aspartate-semialdehyde dehydrogenase [Pseudomonas schmalbachii]
MLPPIPHGLPAQQESPKPRPEVAPVTAAQPDAGVGLKRRPQERTAEEGYQGRRHPPAPPGAAEEESADGQSDVPELEAAPRKGVWVDIEI